MSSVVNPVTQERSRIFGILEHPSAQGREGAALALARVPGMSAEAASAVLAGLPKQKAPSAGGDQFAADLARLGTTERDLLAAADIIVSN